MNSKLIKGMLATALITGASLGMNAQDCGTNACCQNQTPAARLKYKLNSLTKTGNTAFGHHDDTAYGHEWTGV